jgi:chloramphenicol-sensitive protein RarD
MTPTSPSAGAADDPAAARREGAVGVAAALAGFFIWGIAPLYFEAVGEVPAIEVLAHRVLWSAVLLAIVVGLIGRTGEILAIVRAGAATRRAYLVSTTLISVNWFIFIYAIQTDRLLHASLGYYITPLVNVAMGMAFLGERLSLRQGAAVALATLGVANLIVFYGTLPWIALALAMSFGTYALVRKKARIDPLVGLLVETLVIAPLAVGFLAWLAVTGIGHFGPGAGWPGGWGDGWGMTLLLIAAGPVTGIPLVLYMMGAARLKLGTIGLMQYSAPTLQFLIAVWVFGEVFTPAHAVTFALIWTGLVLYSWDMVRSLRRA